MREHIHPAAADGYKTGADTYVRGRPDYQPQVADWLTVTLGLDDDKVSWVPKPNAIVNALEGDTPRYYTGAWRLAFPHKAFGPLQAQHFGHGHTGSPEDVMFNRVRSTSFIAALPQAQRDKVDAQMRALIESEPELHGKDVITVPYVTAAFVAVKRS